MRSLQDIKLAELLPSNLAADPFAAALAKAFDYEFHLLVADTSKLLIYDGIADQPDTVLDHLAWQFGVDFYDQALSRAAKVELVTKALYWHSVKGTPHIVEMVVEAVFGTGTVEEWWEYSGQPFHFRVSTPGGDLPNGDKFDRFFRMIRVVKRATAIMQSLRIEQSGQQTITIGAATHTGLHVTVGSA